MIDLRPDHLQTVQRILAEHVPGCEVRAFGSRAAWTAKDYSDLDLAVVGAGPLDWRTVGRLKEAFEESSLPMRVDVLDWHAIPDSFRQVIERGYVVVQEATKQPTAGDWREVALGDVADIVMGQSPPGDTVSSERGLALLNGPTEFGAHHPAPSQYTTDARKFAQPGDLLFCVRGSTTGRMNWADQEYAIGRGVAAIRHRNEPALQPFVRGVIEVKLPGLLAQATGSTFPNVSAHQLAEIPYPRLDKTEQRAIAHVLGTLDDKIELNRRMNETLEAMAQALFKDWFVDFGPVRAKIAGREPYLPPDVWSLFPDRLAPSELGDIPAGWQVGTVGDVVEQIRDSENPQLSPDALFSHYSIPAFDQGTTPALEYGRDIKSTKSRLEPGVVLLSKLNPEIERVWLVDVDPRERVICSTEFLVLRPRPPFQRGYVYSLARSATFREQIQALVTGTSKSHQRAQAKSVLSVQVVLPSAPVIHAFDQRAAPLLDRVLAYRKEASTLATQRDALLPSLVSGTVRVN